MKRRRLLLAGAAGALLPAAHTLAQPATRKFRVAILPSITVAYAKPYLAALIERLATEGFVEGRNLLIDVSTSDGTFARDREQAARLLSMKPDVVLVTSTRGTQALIAETRSIPIVFTWVWDPVSSGLVRSYSRPGGSATGVSNRFFEVAIKRLELLRELLPTAKRVALTGAIYTPEVDSALPRLREAASRLGFEADVVDTAYTHAQLTEIGRAIKAGAKALVPLHVYTARGERITGEQVVQFLNKNRVPAIFAESELVELGGLMSYGTSLLDDFRRAAGMLAKILKGAKPADLPVDQSSRFELVVNLKTAKAIGITVPSSILLRADRVIE